MPPSGTILTQEAVKVLANHTAIALNHARYTTALVSDEVTQTRKVVLRNRMALDLLTAAQGHLSHSAHGVLRIHP